MTNERFPLFPPDSEVLNVEALRIYCNLPYKGAYVFLKKGIVTHASEELVFAIGWTREKVRERAEKVGFKVAILPQMTKPRDTWLNSFSKPKPAPKPRKKKVKV